VAPRDFPSGSKGLVASADKMKDSDLARVSMGYLVGVTPLQMAVAVSSIANGGELLQPRVVQAIVRGNSRQVLPRVVLRRTVPPEITAQLRTIMEGVVERGTAKAAQLSDYTIAGKTGTAAKLIGGRYSKSEYNASFVGFVPSQKPVYTIVVVINSPHGSHGYYGGGVAAPIFRKIAERLLGYEGVPSLNAPPPVVIAHGPTGGREIPASGPAAAPIVAAAAAANVLPDVTGLSVREAIRTMTRLGVQTHLRGENGAVVGQRPAAGVSLDRNTTVTLWLGRDPASSRRWDATTR
jgi:cell division protein FtsI (penicillin-binding protein 3)/stage V sporulation protein D (sporulation-specific penicillin-binding protein)